MESAYHQPAQDTLTPPPSGAWSLAPENTLFGGKEFHEMLDSSIRQCVSNNTSGALLLAQISNLAMIISGYGHDISENVVLDLMARLQEKLSSCDRIVRLQRDQFGILLTNSYPEETERTAQRFADIMQNYGRDNFATATLHIMGVIGAVHFPSETTEASDALDKAYIALNSAQSSVYRTFSASKREADLCRQQMGLASYLYSAFQEKRLRLAWQPIVDVKKGGVSHYEALLRIKGHNGKISSAGALIPVAEKMGMIETIDMMVMDMVVEELKATPDIHIAFNISNLTTENPVWLDALSSRVEHLPDVASRMMVEMTETAVQRDLRRVAYFVASLQSLGCQVALDDFGSGYTSFRQLKALSVDLVKIDGAFIKDIAINTDSRFFVKTLLDFARGFGLKTVAEFVESGEIAKILMEMGVDYLQGYYLGKPENHRRWLKEGEYCAE